MFCGVHGNFEWDLAGGELRISAANTSVGQLKVMPAPTSFNNAEQAQWFAQGRIDMHLDELTQLARTWDDQTGC